MTNMMEVNKVGEFGVFFISFQMGCSAQVFGKWKTIDDSTGTSPRLFISIYERKTAVCTAKCGRVFSRR